MHIPIPNRQSLVKITAVALAFPGTGFCQFCCLAFVYVIRAVSQSRHKKIQLLLKSELVLPNVPSLARSFTSKCTRLAWQTDCAARKIESILKNSS
ncbi:transmembrane protein, putative [Medicago truncatula]|uniref:Transmembrane protein, putative n=1 Tax=Medicago truncatula TaxID=3880 RepID=A0A072UBD5_MEDTR|nr:transmembrane protein, putative [Medicago truncatula]